MRLALLAALGLITCASDIPPREFDGQTASFGYLERQVGFGYRIPGSPAHAAQAALDGFAAPPTGRHAASAVVEPRHREGRYPPADEFRLPGSSRRRVETAAASWLTGIPGRCRTIRRTTDPRTPVPGANDGASGVAVLLGMADALKRTPPGGRRGPAVRGWRGLRELRLPEKADVLIGSRYYAQNQPPGSPPLYAVLFDLVADKDLKLLPEGQSLLAAPEVVEQVWNVARDIGHGDVFVNTPGLRPHPHRRSRGAAEESGSARSTWSTMHTLIPRATVLAHPGRHAR